MGTHDGHRARMKARFVRCGLDNFDDHSVLELLLFSAVPRRDVNELAHALLDELAHLVQVDVAGDDVRVAVADGNERLAEIVLADARGAEQAAVGGSGVT